MSAASVLARLLVTGWLDIAKQHRQRPPAVDYPKGPR